MCSRYIKKQMDLSEKPKIKKLKKTIQIKCPAPFSQSWSGPPPPAKKASNRSSTGQSHTIGSNAPLVSDTSETGKPRIKTQKEGESSAPFFVVRSLDSRFGRRLSRAASTHLDIKPRNVN